MDRRRVGDHAIPFRVEAEAGVRCIADKRSPRSPGYLGFELAPEGLDVAAADLEQAEVVLVTEGEELGASKAKGSRSRPD
jgi:hypothetical protein